MTSEIKGKSTNKLIFLRRKNNKRDLLCMRQAREGSEAMIIHFCRHVT